MSRMLDHELDITGLDWRAADDTLIAKVYEAILAAASDGRVTWLTTADGRQAAIVSSDTGEEVVKMERRVAELQREVEARRARLADQAASSPTMSVPTGWQAVGDGGPLTVSYTPYDGPCGSHQGSSL